jgi:hypothetical protein
MQSRAILQRPSPFQARTEKISLYPSFLLNIKDIHIKFYKLFCQNKIRLDFRWDMIWVDGSDVDQVFLTFFYAQ